MITIVRTLLTAFLPFKVLPSSKIKQRWGLLTGKSTALTYILHHSLLPRRKLNVSNPTLASLLSVLKALCAHNYPGDTVSFQTSSLSFTQTFLTCASNWPQRVKFLLLLSAAKSDRVGFFVLVSAPWRGGKRWRAMPSKVLLKWLFWGLRRAIQLTAWMHSWVGELGAAFNHCMKSCMRSWCRGLFS